MPSTLKMSKTDLNSYAAVATPPKNFLDRFLLRAECHGNARPMAAIAGIDLELAANLFDEPQDEFHPKPLALGGLNSGR